MRAAHQAGALCFVVKEDVSIAQPNDGTCNAVEVPRFRLGILLPQRL
jgi:hypothetical protein